MNYFEYTYKDKKIPFRMSYGAKKELDDILNKQQDKMNDVDVIKAIKITAKMNKKDISEDEKTELLAEMIPYSSKLNTAMRSIDPIELGYVLLKNHPQFKDFTSDQYEELINDMEETLGFDEVWEKFQDIHDKVFTQMEKMNTPKQKAAPKEIQNLS